MSRNFNRVSIPMQQTIKLISLIVMLTRKTSSIQLSSSSLLIRVLLRVHVKITEFGLFEFVPIVYLLKISRTEKSL